MTNSNLVIQPPTPLPENFLKGEKIEVPSQQIVVLDLCEQGRPPQILIYGHGGPYKIDNILFRDKRVRLTRLNLAPLHLEFKDPVNHKINFLNKGVVITPNANLEYRLNENALMNALSNRLALDADALSRIETNLKGFVRTAFESTFNELPLPAISETWREGLATAIKRRLDRSGALKEFGIEFKKIDIVTIELADLPKVPASDVSFMAYEGPLELAGGYLITEKNKELEMEFQVLGDEFVVFPDRKQNKILPPGKYPLQHLIDPDAVENSLLHKERVIRIKQNNEIVVNDVAQKYYELVDVDKKNKEIVKGLANISEGNNDLDELVNISEENNDLDELVNMHMGVKDIKSNIADQETNYKAGDQKINYSVRLLYVINPNDVNSIDFTNPKRLLGNFGEQIKRLMKKVILETEPSLLQSRKFELDLEEKLLNSQPFQSDLGMFVERLFILNLDLPSERKRPFDSATEDEVRLARKQDLMEPNKFEPGIYIPDGMIAIIRSDSGGLVLLKTGPAREYASISPFQEVRLINGKEWGPLLIPCEVQNSIPVSGVSIPLVSRLVLSVSVQPDFSNLNDEKIVKLYELWALRESSKNWFMWLKGRVNAIVNAVCYSEWSALISQNIPRLSESMKGLLEPELKKVALQLNNLSITTIKLDENTFKAIKQAQEILNKPIQNRIFKELCGPDGRIVGHPTAILIASTRKSLVRVIPGTSQDEYPDISEYAQVQEVNPSIFSPIVVSHSSNPLLPLDGSGGRVPLKVSFDVTIELSVDDDGLDNPTVLEKLIKLEEWETLQKKVVAATEAAADHVSQEGALSLLNNNKLNLAQAIELILEPQMKKRGLLLNATVTKIDLDSRLFETKNVRHEANLLAFRRFEDLKWILIRSLTKARIKSRISEIISKVSFYDIAERDPKALKDIIIAQIAAASKVVERSGSGEEAKILIDEMLKLFAPNSPSSTFQQDENIINTVVENIRNSQEEIAPLSNALPASVILSEQLDQMTAPNLPQKVEQAIEECSKTFSSVKIVVDKSLVTLVYFIEPLNAHIRLVLSDWENYPQVPPLRQLFVTNNEEKKELKPCPKLKSIECWAMGSSLSDIAKDLVERGAELLEGKI